MHPLDPPHYRRHTWAISLFCTDLSPSHFGLLFAANAVGIYLLSVVNAQLLAGSSRACQLL